MSVQDVHDRELDETLEETFPASDAPANTVETGIRVAAPAGTVVVDNEEARRFELTVEGQTAVLNYERRPDALVALHTEVPAELRGRHIGDRLAEAAIDRARTDGVQFVAVCPFVRAFLRRHRDRTGR